MKKLLGLFTAVLYFVSPQLAFAQSAGTLDLCPEGQFQIVCDINSGNFGSVIGTLIIVVFIIAIVIALIWLIIGGIKWITSGGDASKVEAARNQIIAAVIGLVIVFLAFFIINIVLAVFGIEGGLSGLQVPSLDDIL